MKRFTARISFTAPKGIKALLNAKATDQGLSMSEFLHRITIEDELAALTQ